MTQPMEKRSRRMTRKAIRDTFSRIGMQSRPHEVVQELAAHGVYVSKEFVLLVQVEMLKQTAQVKSQLAGMPQPVHSRERQAPRVFPQRRCRSHRGN